METINNILRTKLRSLKKMGVIAVKAGTEVEDMNFDEINLLREISKNIVPLIVKIGGPEARNDLRECVKRKVDVILAPMIESEYAFNNFLSVFDKLTTSKNMKYSINVETKTAVNNLNGIIALQRKEKIFYVTIGRTDLAGSYGLDVDDPKVYKICRKIIKTVQLNNIQISVGGKIKKSNFNRIINELSPDFINTRNVLVSVKDVKSEDVINEVLAFEIELYKLFLQISNDKKSLLKERIIDNRKRMI